jgi:hypothetical protein
MLALDIVAHARVLSKVELDIYRIIRSFAVLPARAVLVPWAMVSSRRFLGLFQFSRLTSLRRADFRILRTESISKASRKPRQDDTNNRQWRERSNAILSTLYPHLLTRVNSNHHDERHHRAVQGRRRRRKRPNINKGYLHSFRCRFTYELSQSKTLMAVLEREQELGFTNMRRLLLYLRSRHRA